MTSADDKDKKESRTLAIALIALVLLVGLGAWLLLPSLIESAAGFATEFAATHFTPGLGLRDAAIVSFFVTAALLIVFAITSGDGLIGELQFMIAGFLLFFLIFWLLLAWVF